MPNNEKLDHEARVAMHSGDYVSRFEDQPIRRTVASMALTGPVTTDQTELPRSRAR